MIDDDLLVELRPRPDADLFPLTEIERRARRIRRHRRVTRATAGTALAMGLVVASFVMPSLSGGPNGGTSFSPGLSGVAQAAASESTGCDSGYARLVEPSTVPTLRYLFAIAPAGTKLTHAWGRAETANCTPPAPAALLVRYGAGGETTTQGLALWGPDAGRPNWGSQVSSPVTVRGVTGVLLDVSSRLNSYQLAWSEPDGATWVAQASGISRGRLLSIVNALNLTNRRLDATSLPHGLTQVTVPAMSTRQWLMWDAIYAADGRRQVHLTVTDAPQLPREIAALYPPGSTVRYLSVNGAPGVYAAVNNGGIRNLPGILAWTDNRGVSFQISGTSQAEALRLADTLHLAAADDPRLERAAPTH